MITAAFDGAERQFHIAREHVPFFEGAMGRSLYAVLRDFTAGEWTFAETAAVISFALHGPSPHDRQAISFMRQAARYGFPGAPVSYRPHPDVIAVLEREGHGNYAALAADILTEAVFGLKEVVDDAA